MYAEVIFDDSIDKTLDYSIPKEMELAFGMRVEAPVRGHLRKGYVFRIKETTEASYLKPIEKILSSEILSKDLFELALFMAKYYCTSLQKILRSMVPSSVRKDIRQKKRLFLTSLKSKKELLELLVKSQGAQAKILEKFLKVKKGIFLSELLQELAVSRSPIDTLIEKKILLAKEELDETTLLLEEEMFLSSPKTFTDEQKKCFDSIAFEKFAVHLLYGITGSGKTEIYLQLIQKALDLGKGSILLVPEISLTPQTIERFRSRFSCKIAVLHHKRSEGERSKAWQDLLHQEAKIVIGARSAVFSPLPNLGLIIVDEEHDSSYKQQDEVPTYHARHIAIMRGKLSHFPVLLGSATPSLESYTLAKQGTYSLHELTKRPGSTLPKVHLIDMTLDREKNGIFSSTLLSAIEERTKKGEQTLLFLNRRGYQTFLFCKECSHVLKCPHCDVTLTYHKKEDLLFCHSCSYSQKPVYECPSCRSKAFAYLGYGTEQVERTLHAIFPSIRTLRIDRDTTGQKDSHERYFQTFRSGKADVLIGTQMIVKGLHFPSVTLVGVLSCDGALNIPDFRSSEIVFQLLTQVAGRAGREELPGEVFIQTMLKSHATIQLALKQDYKAFYSQEIETRKFFDYPPFTKMIKIQFFGIDENTTLRTASSFREKLICYLPQSCKIHPVIPSGKAKIQDHYRFFFLLRSKNMSSVKEALEKVLKEVSFPNSVRLLLDIDPLSTFF